MTVQDLLVNLDSLAMGEVFQQAIAEFYVASLQRLDDNISPHLFSGWVMRSSGLHYKYS